MNTNYFRILITIAIVLFASSLQSCYTPEKLDEDSRMVNACIATLHDQGRYEEAIRLAKPLVWIDKSRAKQNPRGYAASLNNLASLYQTTGQYEKAEPLLREAIGYLEKAFGSKDADLSTIIHNLGGLYSRLGEYDKAKDLYIKVMTNHKDARADGTADYAANLNGLAQLYVSLGQYDQAKPLSQEVVQICRNIMGEKDPKYALSLDSLAGIHFCLGEYDKAAALSGEALRIRKESRGEDHPDYAASLHNVARMHEEMDEYRSAEPLYAHAVQIASTAGKPLEESIYRNRHAECLRLMNRPDEAIREFNAGIGLFEHLRGALSMEKRRILFQSLHGNDYSNLAATYLQRGDKENAFKTIERGRAKSLMDLFATSKVRERKSKDGIGELTCIERELEALREQRWTSTNTELPQRISEREERRGEIIEEMKSVAPELGGLVSVSPFDLSEFQSTLGDEITVVEYYHPGKMAYAGCESRDELWVFALTKNSFNFETVPVDMLSLINDLEKIAALLSDNRSDLSEIEILSENLYKHLLGPIEKHMRGRTLVIVPWGPMFKIPFACLKDENGYFLAEKTDVVIAPSLGVYRYLLRKRKSGRKILLGIGAPDTGGPSLTGASQEAKYIAELFPHSLVRQGPRATESFVRQSFRKLGKPDIVHFACHGVFKKDIHQSSYLALTPDSKNDGKLEMNEIFDLEWEGVSLVTLSACSSGRGKLGPGDDLIGLTRGFMYAGAPSVLCSLWDVDDEATRQLMLEFYANYVEKEMSKPESLRQAQLAMIRSKKWTHPYYWSAFELFGDWE